MELDINFEDSTFKLETIEEEFKSKKEKLPTQTVEQVKHLLGDLKYLGEMKRLEGAKDGDKMSHILLFINRKIKSNYFFLPHKNIVPIGGLVFNHLMRYVISYTVIIPHYYVQALE